MSKLENGASSGMTVAAAAVAAASRFVVNVKPNDDDALRR